jgi:hypothetical protein
LGRFESTTSEEVLSLMAAQNPEEAALAAKIASNTRWGRTADRAAALAPAHAGLRAKFLREADPDGTLDPGERERRADQLHRAHMLRMTLAAKRARRLAREAAAEADAAEAALDDMGAAS